MSTPYKYTMRFFSFICFLSLSTMSYSTQYWVAKSGSDSNNCTNETTDACLTIQKGVSLLNAGDTLNVKSGTYSDDGGNSSYKPSGTYCAWLDNQPSSSSVCVNSNGTPNNPIIIQAAPGDEGSVIIDSQGQRIGIHLQNSDYIHVRGFKLINNSVIGIASWGQPENSVADESRLSISCVIENNDIATVTGPSGKNVSGIGMWGTKDWVVRNNKIDDITVASGHNASGIQAYGTINALVENNYITNALMGIYWKDHFLLDATGNGVPVFESEVRYNVFENIQRGFYVAGANEQAGINHVHHNIFRNYSEAGIFVNAKYNSMPGHATDLTINNNLFDGVHSSATAIFNDVYLNTKITANIFTRNKAPYEFAVYDVNEAPQLASSNYNIFDTAFGAMSMDHFSNTNKKYYSLADWQNARASNHISLAIDNPDISSITKASSELVSTSTLINLAKATNNGILPDGSHPGPYQTGFESIGLKPNWPRYSNVNTLPKANPPPGGVTVKKLE